jgi:hypothetical protein
MSQRSGEPASGCPGLFLLSLQALLMMATRRRSRGMTLKRTTASRTATNRGTVCARLGPKSHVCPSIGGNIPAGHTDPDRFPRMAGQHPGAPGTSLMFAPARSKQAKRGMA